MGERTLAATAVYLVLRKGPFVLIARRVNTGYQDGNYQVPAGHIEPGELPTEAMVREAKEELGIDIDSDDLRFAHIGFRTKIDDTGDRVDYYFEATCWDGQVQNMEKNKCDDLRWVIVDELPQNTTPHVRIALESMARGEMYSELDYELMKRQQLYNLK